MEVRIQSVVVEFILNHVDVLFSGKINAVIQEGAGRPTRTLVPTGNVFLNPHHFSEQHLLSQFNKSVSKESS